MTTGVDTLQTATDITAEGQQKRQQLCELFGHGKEPVYRPAVSPHFLTMSEKAFYDDDSRRTILSLKTKFLSLIEKLPESSVAAEICDAMNHADAHAEVLSAMSDLRQIYAGIVTDADGDD